MIIPSIPSFVKNKADIYRAGSAEKEAIDFEAAAFVEGVGFQPVKLSDYNGKWNVLCFYPADFTFV